ncbi:MAG TPA: sulfotransferase [Verrucomicrobiae bacterium]|nr:sulfotransferase [Verrucomicrobiae bacterium]
MEIRLPCNSAAANIRFLFLMRIIQKARRRFVEKMQALMADDWPKPQYPPLLEDPVFLFILTPPHSGSTALAQVLNSGFTSTLLEERAEGQWLVPGLCQKDRWNPNKYVDWESVRAVWFSRLSFIERLVGSRNVVIEKSPPNMIRAETLLRAFPRHKVVVFNRNPYACCASILYRKHKPVEISRDKRLETLKTVAVLWALRSDLLKTHVETFSPVSFTYEAFCKDPDNKVQEVIAQVPELRGIDTKRKIRVKDYKPQGIFNQNERQIGNLSHEERKSIGEVLRPYEAVLRFFGYTSDWQKNIEQGGAGTA